MKRARGSYRRDDAERINPQIVARFDRETFDEIAAFAESKGLSFNAALRVLAEWGLMAAKNRDQDHDRRTQNCALNSGMVRRAL
jgi:hypothetical protein